jgi:hypothetical protein
MPADASQRIEQLWPLFHHSPVAMAETDQTGVLRQVNPKAVQLMMPMAAYLGLSGDNLLDTLDGFIPTLRETITDFLSESGPIITQEPYRIRFAVGDTRIERHFNLSINKKDPDSLLIFFEDVTDFLVKADALRQRS